MYNKYQNRVGDLFKTRKLKSKVLIKGGSQVNCLHKINFCSKNLVVVERRIKFAENLRSFKVIYYDSYQKQVN